MKTPKPIIIRWIDSSSATVAGWTRLKDWDMSPATCTSVGILVKETKHNIMISSAVASTGQIQSPHVIPKCAIISRDDLDVVRKKKAK